MVQLGTKQTAKAFTGAVHSYSPFSMALSQFCSFFCESVFFIYSIWYGRTVLALTAPTSSLTNLSKNSGQRCGSFGISKQFAEFQE